MYHNHNPINILRCRYCIYLGIATMWSTQCHQLPLMVRIPIKVMSGVYGRFPTFHGPWGIYRYTEVAILWIYIWHDLLSIYIYIWLPLIMGVSMNGGTTKFLVYNGNFHMDHHGSRETNAEKFLTSERCRLRCRRLRRLRLRFRRGDAPWAPRRGERRLERLAPGAMRYILYIYI